MTLWKIKPPKFHWQKLSFLKRMMSPGSSLNVPNTRREPRFFIHVLSPKTYQTLNLFNQHVCANDTVPFCAVAFFFAALFSRLFITFYHFLRVSSHHTVPRNQLVALFISSMNFVFVLLLHIYIYIHCVCVCKANNFLLAFAELSNLLQKI